MPSNKKSIRPLIWLLFVFIFPIVISAFLYYYHSHFHFKTTNHGILVIPVLPVQEQLSVDTSKRQWQLVYEPMQCCDTQCQKTMYDLYQIHAALGKDYSRVNLCVMYTETCQIIQNDVTHLKVSQAQKKWVQNALSQQGVKFLTESKIYLLDPKGNLMMYYPGNVEALNVLKDVKHLLGVTQIG